jgi:hypothetical protein
MSHEDGDQTVLRFPGEERQFSVARSATYEFAMLEELRFVRREAQAEANDAYEYWRLRPHRDAYTAYRAAQDRADAAQDQLAGWAAQVAR